MSAHLEVLRPGPLATVQDGGRPGHRAIGVSPSGAADRGAFARANALVGNEPGAAVIEATLGGLHLRARGEVVLALSGAACPGAAMDAATLLRDGEELRLAAARVGLRTYVAVRGGIAVPAVLGSRSRDTLAGLGPPPLRAGDVLPVGDGAGEATPPALEPAAAGPDDGGQNAPVPLTLIPGPRDDWLGRDGWNALAAGRWRIAVDSNRVAVRLEGPALPIRIASLPPEPLVRGAVQVPPDGRPLIFGADHPVTGGYPVIGVLTAGSSDRLAQLRPGALVAPAWFGPPPAE